VRQSSALRGGSSRLVATCTGRTRTVAVVLTSVPQSPRLRQLADRRVDTCSRNLHSNRLCKKYVKSSKNLPVTIRPTCYKLQNYRKLQKNCKTTKLINNDEIQAGLLSTAVYVATRCWKNWRYVHSFRQNTWTWKTDRQTDGLTDTARRHAGKN